MNIMQNPYDPCAGTDETWIINQLSSELSWSPDGNRLAFASYSVNIEQCAVRSKVEILDQNGQLLMVLVQQNVPFPGLAWDAAGTRLAASDADGYIYIWDTLSGQLLNSFRLSNLAILELSWHPNNSWLAAGGYDNNVIILDAATGQVIMDRSLGATDLPGLVAGVSWMKWNPDGTYLALGNADGSLYILNGLDLSTVRTMVIREMGSIQFAWSPDGSQIISSSEGNEGYVWDVETGQNRFSLNGHLDRINGMAWSPFGDFIVTSSRDATIRIWNAATGELLSTFTFPDSVTETLHLDWSVQNKIAFGVANNVEAESTSDLPPLFIPPSSIPTPTFLPQTITAQVTSGTDDVNEDGSAYYEEDNVLGWVGNGIHTAGSVLGLRFANLAVPPGAVITEARLEVHINHISWINVDAEIAAEASDNAVTFSAASKPSQRALSSARIQHSSNVEWQADTWYALEDVTPLLQETVNRPGWQSGSGLSLIFTGTGDAYGRKFFHSYEYDPQYAPRLVVTYVNGVSSYPVNGILDRFDRANGDVGSSWTTETDAYAINNNQLVRGTGDAALIWAGNGFGATQEAFVTFGALDAQDDFVALRLKSGNDTFLQVEYHLNRQKVEIWTYNLSQDWVQHGTAINASLTVGDQFGVRAGADGRVEVFKNGTLLGARSITGWTDYAAGGSIGLWLREGSASRLDDFGGGNG